MGPPVLSPEGCGSKWIQEQQKTSPWIGTRGHGAALTLPDAESMQCAEQIALNAQILPWATPC